MGRVSCTLTDYPRGAEPIPGIRHFEYLTLSIMGNLREIGNVRMFYKQLSNQPAVAIVNIPDEDTCETNGCIR